MNAMKKATSLRLSENTVTSLYEISQDQGISQTKVVETSVGAYQVLQKRAFASATDFIGRIEQLADPARPLVLNLREGWVTSDQRLEGVAVRTWEEGDEVIVCLTTPGHFEGEPEYPTDPDQPLLVVATLDREVFAVHSFVAVDLETLRPDSQYFCGHFRSTQQHVLGAIRTAIKEKGGRVSTAEVGVGSPPRFS